MQSLFDLSHIPEIFALVILIGCFRPLARRVGAQANLWFVGWTFLLLHFAAETVLPHAGKLSNVVTVVGCWCVLLCFLLFAFIAEGDPAERIGRAQAWALPPAVLFQATLAIFPVHPGALDRLAVVFFAVTALFVFFSGWRRSLQTYLLSGCFLIFAGYALLFDPTNLSVPGHVEQTCLLLTAACLFFRSAKRRHRGVIAATAGLAGWALTYQAAQLLSGVFDFSRLPATVLELPVYLMAGGIVLTLLEEHVVRTERLAMHDPLTDLPNRRMFEDRLAETLEEAKRDRTTIACLVIDVDNFKAINDTLGHDAGDQLLRALAVRLSWHISPRDLLARTGGDEFTALLAGVHDEHHLKFIAGAMMSASSVPILVDGNSVDVRISIGIALSPDHADDTASLRRAADQAMYSAKRRGGSILAFAGEE